MIYLFLLAITPILVRFLFNDNDIDSTPKRRLIYLLCCGIIIFIVLAARSQYVGSPDTNTYCKLFDTLKNYPSFSLVKEEKQMDKSLFIFSEVLFYLYLWIISRITQNSQFLLIINSAIIIFCTFYFIYKNSKNVMLSVLVFVCFGLLTFSMNGMRQALAMSICLLSFEFVKQRKFILFAIIIFISMLFHKTAIFFLPIYFLTNFKYNIKTLIAYLVIYGLLFIFGNKIATLFGMLSAKDYSTDQTSESGGYMTILIYCITIGLMVLYCHNQLKTDGWIRCLFFTCIIGLSLYLFRYFLSQGYERICYYYYYSTLILIPEAVDNLDKKNKTIYTYLLATFAILLFMYRVNNTNFKDFELLVNNINLLRGIL